MVANAFSAVIMIFILMAIGFLVSKTKWYSESAQSYISKLVLNVTLPCTIAVAFLKNFTPGMVVSYAPAFLVAACATMATYFAARLVARIMKVKRDRLGVFLMLITVSNCGFIGIPVSHVLFGDEGIVPTIIIFLVQSIIINTIGYLDISADADCEVKPDRKTILKRIFNPLLLTSLGCATIASLGVSLDVLPYFISNTLVLIDGITAPLSLIFIGMVMGSLGIKNLKFQKDMPVIFVMRFVAAPLFILLFGVLFRLDGFTVQVLTVIGALSSMVQVAILAKAAGAKLKYAVTGIFYTTILNLAAIPIYVIITSNLLL